MRRTLARDVLRTGVSKLDEINIAKEAFARAEEHWGYRQIQLIDESGAKILLNTLTLDMGWAPIARVVNLILRLVSLP